MVRVWVRVSVVIWSGYVRVRVRIRVGFGLRLYVWGYG